MHHPRSLFAAALSVCACSLDPTALERAEQSLSTADLTIQAGTSLGAMPAYGFNLANFNDAQGLYDGDLTDGSPMNEALARPATTIGADWLRFPGGTWANLFDWRTSIGANREGLHSFKLTRETYRFGLLEAARFAERLGGRLLCVININLGANVAANWVEYLNAPVGTNPRGGTAWAELREQHLRDLGLPPRPNGFGIKYWELANENGNQRIWQRWDTDVDPTSPDGAIKGDGGTFTDQERAWVISGGTRTFANYQAVTRSVWKYDDPALQFTGQPRETRLTKLAPISLTGLIVKVGTTPANAVPWTRVADLAGARPADHVYTANPFSGALTFAHPPAGAFAYTTFTFRGDGLETIAAEMKQVDASLTVSSSFLFTHTARAALPHIDGVQLHFVAGPEPSNDASATFRDMMRRAWGEAAFRLTRERTRNPSLSIFATEFHPWQAAYLPNRNYRDTAIGAVGLAMSYAAAAERAPHVAVVGPNYLMTGPALFAEAPIDPGTGAIRAEGWAHQVFRRHAGAERVGVDVVNVGSTSYPATATEPAATVPHLVVTASRTGDELYLIVTNTTPGTTLTKTITTTAPFGPSMLRERTVVASTAAIDVPGAVTPRHQVFPAATRATWATAGRITLTFPPASITALRFSRAAFDIKAVSPAATLLTGRDPLEVVLSQPLGATPAASLSVWNGAHAEFLRGSAPSQVPGRWVASGEARLRFIPDAPWAPGQLHQLRVDAALRSRWGDPLGATGFRSLLADDGVALGAETVSIANVRSIAEPKLPMVIVRPAQRTGRVPAVLFVHGGGWSGATAAAPMPGAAHLASHGGFASVGLGYRTLGSQGTFALALQDLEAGLAWVVAHGAEQGLDASRLCLAGASAGAPLAALLAQRHPVIRCFIGFNGLYDFVQNASSAFPASTTYQHDVPSLAANSALRHLRAQPPATLTLHGTADTTISSNQSWRLGQAVVAAGAPHRGLFYLGQPHGFFQPGHAGEVPVLFEVLRFLKARL
ncbi:MAG: alpha/beta hydrolase fold domain-containing protein [Kofleriaceae bacterium]